MNKKVIIVEGPDNVGKSSLINKLKSQLNNCIVVHAAVPTSDDLFKYYYSTFIRSTLDAYYDKCTDAIIHDRSMYGEYVYGTKYRHKTKEEISDIISKLEIGQLKTYILSNELFFILLTTDNSDLLVNNDDGKSISSKKSDIDNEISLFNEVFKLSNIDNKYKVLVNNADKFRSQDDIFNEVISFIANKGE